MQGDCSPLIIRKGQTPHTVWTANPSSEAKPSSPLEAYKHTDGSIVITLAPGLTMEKLQAQSVRGALNCLDKSFLPCRDKTTTLKLLAHIRHVKIESAIKHAPKPWL